VVRPICLERDSDLHMAQLMPLPLTVSCFSKIQIGFTFLVPVHLGSPGQRAVKRVCVCVCVTCRLTAKNRDQLQTLRSTIEYRLPLPFLLHTFNGLFLRTTWVSQYQEGKTSLDLNEARDDGVWGSNGIMAYVGPYANNLHLSPD